MGSERPTYVCHACIGDKALAQQVEEAGTYARCSYCHAAGMAITLAELSDRIRQVLEEHFKPNPILLESEGIELETGVYLSDHLRSYPEDTETVIDTIANLAYSIAREVRELLFNSFAESADASKGDVNPYNSDMLYQEREGDPSGYRLAWWEFKDEIQSKARYFGTKAAERLGDIFANLNSPKTFSGGPVIREINPGDSDSSFWRARAVYSGSEWKKILASPVQEIGPPPSNKAKSGRMNAEGIPVFYGALDEPTCVAEIRPPVGSYVVLGKFELLARVRILDLTALSTAASELSYFDSNYTEVRSREKFLREWVKEISRPVIPQEEAREYLASQVVADYLANRVEPRLDGMIFNSSQTGGTGRNLVLFNHACSVVADESHLAPGLRLTVPREPTIPLPGTESSQDLLIQTEPQRAVGETERIVENPITSNPETQGSHCNSILTLDQQSLKVLAISGTKYDHESLPLYRDHSVSAGTIGFHFDLPTPKVTVSRRKQVQDQETEQEPVEVDPEIQTSS